MAVLTYRGTELRDLTVGRRWFDIDSGWRDGVEVRGEDTVIPGAAGQTARNRVANLRVIPLRGYVYGTSEANWDSEMAVLEALFDPTLAPGALVVTSPYMGLAAGTRTISARVLNYITVDLEPQLVTRWDVTLHCISNPPNWT